MDKIGQNDNWVGKLTNSNQLYNVLHFSNQFLWFWDIETWERKTLQQASWAKIAIDKSVIFFEYTEIYLASYIQKLMCFHSATA